MGAAGLLIAASAFLLVSQGGCSPGFIFDRILTGPIIAGLVAWLFIAFGARRLRVGRIVGPTVVSPTLLLWVGLRLSLVLSIVILFLSWLAAFALGLEIQTPLVNAVGSF